MNPNDTISTIMTEATISVHPGDSLTEIENIFKQFLIHHLPVIDKEQKVVGIISKIDALLFLKNLAQKSSGKSYSRYTIENTTAAEIMTADPTVIDPDDTIGLAADIFLANTFHTLPVVEDDKLVGIITSHDLLQSVFKEVYYGREA